MKRKIISIILINSLSFIAKPMGLEITQLDKNLQKIVLDYINFYCPEYGSKFKARIKYSSIPVYSKVNNMLAVGVGSSIKILDDSSNKTLLLHENSKNVPLGLDNGAILALSNDGKYLANTNSYLDSIKIWKMADEKQSGQIALELEERTFNFIFNADAKKIIYLNLHHINKCVARVRDIASNKIEKSITLDNSFQFSHEFRNFAFSNNTNYFACSVRNKEKFAIKIYSIESEKEISTLAESDCSISGLTFSPDDKYIATLSAKEYVNIPEMGFQRASDEKIIKIWDINTGNCIKSFQGLNGLECTSFINQPENLAIVQKSPHLLVFNLLHTLIFTFCPNGKYIAGTFMLTLSMSDQKKWYYFTKIWDIQSGTCLQTIEDTKGISFSHDGIELALVSSKNSKILKILKNQTLEITQAKKKSEQKSNCVIS